MSDGRGERELKGGVVGLALDAQSYLRSTAGAR